MNKVKDGGIVDQVEEDRKKLKICWSSVEQK